MWIQLYNGPWDGAEIVFHESPIIRLVIADKWEYQNRQCTPAPDARVGHAIYERQGTKAFFLHNIWK